jgi:uncharacterized protein YuzE
MPKQRKGGCSAMDQREMIPDSPHVDVTTFDNISKFTCNYHQDKDILFIREKTPRPAISVDWGGEVWVRIEPTTGEIVGLEIEDFETVFIKKYPEIDKAWKEARSYCCKPGTSKNNVESSLLIILNFIRTLLKDKPKQGTLNLIPIN